MFDMFVATERLINTVSLLIIGGCWNISDMPVKALSGFESHRRQRAILDNGKCSADVFTSLTSWTKLVDMG